MSIHIVTHCYAAEHKHFAHFLRYQMSSLLLHTPNCRVCLEVCMTERDALTVQLVGWFLSRKLPSQVSLHARFMSEGDLWKRSIGRNLAALRTTYGLVWFCDCDYFFGPGCLDSLWEQFPQMRSSGSSLFYPRTIKVSNSHDVGDRAALRAELAEGLLDVEEGDFHETQYTKAIGGAQIVRGEDARVHGYLRNSARHQKPSSTPFPSFRDDVSMRKQYTSFGSQCAVDVKNLYRQRHSRSSYR